MDLGHQTVNAVGDPGDFTGQVVIEADDDFQIGQGLVVHVDPAQCVRQRAARIGDHVGVPCVGLGVPRMQVRDPAHRQAGQVGHVQADIAGHGHGQRPDRGRLIDDHQDRTEGGQLLEQCSQPGLILGQRSVVQPFALG